MQTLESLSVQAWDEYYDHGKDEWIKKDTKYQWSKEIGRAHV